MTSAHRTGPNRTPRKEAFYVRVTLPDDTSQFMLATEFIGREMPFDKPRETCAVRMYDDVVALSLLHVTKRRASSLQGKVIAMPSGMLTRLARRAKELDDLEPGVVIIERENELHRLKMVTDDHGVAHLEAEEGEPAIELDPRGERLSLYLKSPVRDKILALAFIGHLGKPGTPETITRCAAKVMNAALALDIFRVLAGVETLAVPSRPGITSTTQMVRSVSAEFPIFLYTDPAAAGEAPTPVAAGKAVLEVNLEHANAATENLLYKIHPDERIAPHFEAYKETCTSFLASQIRAALGDDLRGIVLDVVLGEVEQSTADRVREMLEEGLGGVDLTPTQWRFCTSTPAPVD